MKADLAIKNGQIWTVDEQLPKAEALAIGGNEILFVGSDDHIEDWIGPNTQVLDMEGRLVLPGFNDSHTHFVAASMISATNLDLFDVFDIKEIQRRLEVFSEARPDDEILFGTRWMPGHINNGVWPNRADLDAVVPDRPVIIQDIEYHNRWLNTAAIEKYGIDASTPDPEGGIIHREASGYPSGIFSAKAQHQVFPNYPEVSPKAFEQLLINEIEKFTSLGITSISNNWTQPMHRDVIEKLDREGTLNLRINEWPMLFEDGLESGVELRERFKSSEKIRVNTFKAFMDSVLGSYTAWMLEPYADKPGETGFPMIEPDKLEEQILEADRLGFQVTTHATGTRAIRTVLDIYERVGQMNGRQDARHRIEHVSACHPDDLPRFAQLGVIASMQPLHLTMEDYVIPKLGDKGHYGFQWQGLIASGAHLCFSTDWPSLVWKNPSPLATIFGAVARCRPEKYGKFEWYPEQRVTVKDAIRSYTLEGAYAECLEHRKGSLTVGKLADLVVLSRNILDTPPEEILETEVLLTIFGGKVIYRKAIP